MISSFQKLLAERYLLRTFNRTICSSETARWPFYVPKISKISKSITSKNVRDYFSLVANLFADVLVKKSVAARRRRTEIRRTVWLSGTHISLKIIVGCPWSNQYSSPLLFFFLFFFFFFRIAESSPYVFFLNSRKIFGGVKICSSEKRSNTDTRLCHVPQGLSYFPREGNSLGTRLPWQDN